MKQNVIKRRTFLGLIGSVPFLGRFFPGQAAVDVVTASLIDSSGNGHHGTIFNADLTTEVRVWDRALSREECVQVYKDSRVGYRRMLRRLN